MEGVELCMGVGYQTFRRYKNYQGREELADVRSNMGKLNIVMMHRFTCGWIIWWFGFNSHGSRIITFRIIGKEFKFRMIVQYQLG